MDKPKNPYIYASVKIRQENMPWNWNQNNPQARRQKQEELNKKFLNDFYTLVNAVVDSGGTVCLDKYILDSEWRIYNNQNTFKIKILKEISPTIQALPFIETFVTQEIL